MADNLELKLFVWEGEDILPNELGGGIMSALAENVEQARELILKKEYSTYSNDKKEKITEEAFLSTYHGFVKDLRCHSPSDTTCKEGLKYNKWSKLQLYHDLNLKPRIVKKPEGFVGWGSDY